MTVTVVAVGPAHADVLAVLHAACFDDPWPATALISLLAQPGVVAKLAHADDGTPVGLVILRGAADEAEVLTIGVTPPLRRTGIAARLLDAGLRAVKAAGITSVFLEVAVDNPTAMAFYRGAEFTKVGVRKKYYKRTEGRVDAFVLRRAL